MARIRSIKPELWDSEKLGRLPTLSRLNFIGLISLADDEGRGRGNIQYLRGRMHPYAPDVTIDSFEKSLESLKTERLAHFYDTEGCSYYCIPGWRDHQKIDRPSLSRIPICPFCDDEKNIRRTFVEDSSNVRRALVAGREGIGEEGIKDRIKDGKGLLFDPLEVAQTEPMPSELADVISKLSRVKLENIGVLYRGWKNAFPDVNIPMEILKCDVWAIAKKRTRSAKGWAITLNRWLSEEQDKTRGAKNGERDRGSAGAAAPKPGKYAGISKKN